MLKMYPSFGLALCSLALLSPSEVMSASFDCSRASTSVEKLVCADAELSSLDEHLAAAYRQARSNSTNLEALRTSQASWLRTNRNACRDAQCLASAYRARIEELSAPNGETTVEGIIEVGADFGSIVPESGDSVGFSVGSQPWDLILEQCKLGDRCRVVGTVPAGSKVPVFSAAASATRVSAGQLVQQSPAPATTSRILPLPDRIQHLLEIGFSEDELQTKIHVYLDMVNPPVEVTTLGEFLALFVDAAGENKIERATSIFGGVGYKLKVPGRELSGMLFNLEGGDAFPSAAWDGSSWRRIEDQMQQIMFGRIVVAATRQQGG